ncbi:hypothetical protein R1flu_019740 [Riccia fluitans]|uniref:Uncharacterized protein n=1 Tax=Riccia fluitans TaxID=41844 RepID=A0ABD1ZJX4_9MARC
MAAIHKDELGERFDMNEVLCENLLAEGISTVDFYLSETFCCSFTLQAIAKPEAFGAVNCETERKQLRILSAVAVGLLGRENSQQQQTRLRYTLSLG